MFRCSDFVKIRKARRFSLAVVGSGFWPVVIYLIITQSSVAVYLHCICSTHLCFKSVCRCIFIYLSVCLVSMLPRLCIGAEQAWILAGWAGRQSHVQYEPHSSLGFPAVSWCESGWCQQWLFQTFFFFFPVFVVFLNEFMSFCNEY